MQAGDTETDHSLERGCRPSNWVETVPLGALAAVGMSNPSVQPWAEILFCGEGHKLPGAALLSALSTHFYFPSNQV